VRHPRFVLYDQYMYRGADKSLARAGRKQVMFLSEWPEFPSAPCLAWKENLMTARVSILLKVLQNYYIIM